VLAELGSWTNSESPPSFAEAPCYCAILRSEGDAGQLKK
jgi:hypothetical protein